MDQLISDINSKDALINMENETICQTPYSASSSSLSCFKKQSYTPTPKLSERKRALFPISTESKSSLDYSDMNRLIYSSDSSSANSFKPQTLCPLGNSNLLKKSSLLSHIEDANNVDFLLSVENSNDFDIVLPPCHTPNLNDSKTDQSSPSQVQNFHSAIRTYKPVKFNNCDRDKKHTQSSSPQITTSPSPHGYVAINKENICNTQQILVAVEKPAVERLVFGVINSNVDSSIESTVPNVLPQKNTPRTPYETLNTQLELPRINNRKSLLGIFNSYPDTINESLDEKYVDLGNLFNIGLDQATTKSPDIHDSSPRLNDGSLKRKLDNSPITVVSPPAKSAKFPDKKLPKARTSLFATLNENLYPESPCNFSSEEIAGPDRSFYSEIPVDNTNCHVDPQMPEITLNENVVEELSDDDNGFSPKLFYSKTQISGKSPLTDKFYGETSSIFPTPPATVQPKIKSKRTSVKQSVYLCGRTKKRNSFGEINAGVRTGIKKAKPKLKLNRTLTKNVNFKHEALKMVRNQSKQKINETPISKCPTSHVQMNTSINDPPVPKTKRALSPDVTYPNLLPEVYSRKFQKTDTSKVLTRHELRTSMRQEKPATDDLPVKPKKFFKSRCPGENVTISITQNVKVTVENGRVKLQAPKTRRYNTKAYQPAPMLFETADLIVPDEIAPKQKIEAAIEILENDIEPTPSGVVLSAHYSAAPDSNSIILYQPPNDVEMQTAPKSDIPQKLPQITRLNTPENVIMSPTSIMCNLTSGLALTSPKKIKITKAENLSDKLAQCPDKNASSSECPTYYRSQKLYPLFMKGHNPNVFSPSSLNKKVTRSGRVWRTLEDRQLQLDAGQKRWGATQCPQCEVVYQQGEPDDEQKHQDFHYKVQYLKFSGWKNERIVGYIKNNQARIIEISPGDSKAWWKRITDLLFVVDQDLGYDPTGFIDTTTTKVYLYIERKQILGFLSVKPISRAFKMIPIESVDCCTEESFPAKCGVTRLWVASSYRRTGIATSLMDTMCRVFAFGGHLSLNDIAFGIPSVSGKSFAKKYTKTEEFLVYTDE